MPKEVFSAALGNITIYSFEELKKLLSMPEAELNKKLNDGSLRAQKIKDAWYVPDEVIAEQRKLTTRLAAAGGRASRSRRARNILAASIAALTLLLAGIAAYNIFGPEPVTVTGCDSPGLNAMVIRSIAASALMQEIGRDITEACSREALSGNTDAYDKCTVFVKKQGSGLMEIGELVDITSVTESGTGLSCTATLEAVASFPIEYNVTVSDGVAGTVSVSLR